MEAPYAQKNDRSGDGLRAEPIIKAARVTDSRCLKGVRMTWRGGGGRFTTTVPVGCYCYPALNVPWKSVEFQFWTLSRYVQGDTSPGEPGLG